MTVISYMHYSEWPHHEWRWPDFSPREMACKGSGELLLNTEAMDKLQALRTKLDRPFLITSAYRSPAHNAAVGGAPNSYHMRGMAFDVRMENHDPHEFRAAAKSVGFTGFGFYIRNGFMHIDIGPARSWGKMWPKTVTALPVEPPRVEEESDDAPRKFEYDIPPVRESRQPQGWFAALIEMIFGGPKK